MKQKLILEKSKKKLMTGQKRGVSDRISQVREATVLQCAAINGIYVKRPWKTNNSYAYRVAAVRSELLHGSFLAQERYSTQRKGQIVQNVMFQANPNLKRNLRKEGLHLEISTV